MINNKVYRHFLYFFRSSTLHALRFPIFTLNIIKVERVIPKFVHFLLNFEKAMATYEFWRCFTLNIWCGDLIPGGASSPGFQETYMVSKFYYLENGKKNRS